MSFIDNLERKMGKYAIKHLFIYIIGAYIAGYILYLCGAVSILNALALDPEAILHGQVWRIVTFVVQPPTNAMSIFFFLTIYFYFFFGLSLERIWGSFRFDLYYFNGLFILAGVSLLVYVVTGVKLNMTPYYLGMSMFIALAFSLPDEWLNLFFCIPMKIKWLAVIDFIYIAATVVFGYIFTGITVGSSFGYVLSALGIRLGASNATSALAAIGILFLCGLLFKPSYKATKTQSEFRKYKAGQEKENRNNNDKKVYHRCEICKKTNLDDPEETFRFCSQCEGSHEYCSEHLKNHTHIRINIRK